MDQMDLFAEEKPVMQPLASRLRPETLDEFVGQTHLLGPGKILRQAVCDRAGHLSVHLGKYCRGIPVHQLVMLAFHGFPPPGLEAMHLNGNPKDNRPENLKYGTHSENMIDMYRKGKGGIKLTPEDVRQIRFALHCGWSLWELAGAYGVSDSCIRDIGKGRSYAWVA